MSEDLKSSWYQIIGKNSIHLDLSQIANNLEMTRKRKRAHMFPFLIIPVL